MTHEYMQHCIFQPCQSDQFPLDLHLSLLRVQLERAATQHLMFASAPALCSAQDCFDTGEQLTRVKRKSKAVISTSSKCEQLAKFIVLVIEDKDRGTISVLPQVATEFYT